MGKNIEVEYVVDKETKGTYRFKPKDEALIGNATIYLPKPVMKENGIDPEKGFDLIIRPK